MVASLTNRVLAAVVAAREEVVAVSDALDDVMATPPFDFGPSVRRRNSLGCR